MLFLKRTYSVISIKKLTDFNLAVIITSSIYTVVEYYRILDRIKSVLIVPVGSIIARILVKADGL
jgi:hypothetical protein